MTFICCTYVYIYIYIYIYIYLYIYTVYLYYFSYVIILYVCSMYILFDMLNIFCVAVMYVVKFHPSFSLGYFLLSLSNVVKVHLLITN